MTVAAPFANPTASCDRFSSIAKAEIWTSQPKIQRIPPGEILTGNCFLPLCMPSVDKHFGAAVFLSVWSRAQTFNTGSFERSSEIVTRSAVPSSCFICVIEPVSCALKVLTTLKAWERM